MERSSSRTVCRSVAYQLTAIIAVLIASRVSADELTTEQTKFFEAKIRPVLVEHCYECHAEGAKNVRGGLLLDTRAGIRTGGESGPAVVPNNLDESLIVDALRHDSFEMPPDRKLPDSVIQDFEKWISNGAPDPRDGEVSRRSIGIDLEAGRKFWCFQPIRNAKPPNVSDKEWPATDIDRFVLNRLESNGLRPINDVEATALLRRVYYDLIGLPPTAKQIDDFLKNESPQAFEQVVDELLRSKHFGERWGRHWLDVVRFAESSGGGRTLLFPDAWRYRDYVIESFNDDLPYNEFVRQQLAGDLMEASDWQERRKQITATAFLVLGPTNYELQDKEVLEMDIVDEQLDTLGKAMLGMTIGCARCHDHKFDPIPTTDYYALAGIFKSTLSVIHSNVSKWNESKLPLAPDAEAVRKKADTQIATLQKDLDRLQAELEKLGGNPKGKGAAIDPKLLPGIIIDDLQASKQGNWTASTSIAGYYAQNYVHSSDAASSITFAPKLPSPGTYEVRVTYTPSSNRSPDVPIRIVHSSGESTVRVNQQNGGSISRSIDSLGFFEFDPAKNPQVIISPDGAASGVVIADAVAFVPKDKSVSIAGAKVSKEVVKQRRKLQSEIDAIQQSIKQVESTSPKREITMAVVDDDSIADIPISIRGIVHNPGPIVPRGVLQVVSLSNTPAIDDRASGRAQLAEWLVDRRNPLAARVIVNRVWYWLYGQGIVRTVDNFGATGETPSHPELLDYLASEFIQDDWSIKRLVRRLVLSRTYRLGSLPNDSLATEDPDNRLFGRMKRRRLDAESIRDSLLLVSGNLDLSIGGPSIRSGTKSEYGYEFSSTRRSVYVPVFRNELLPFFATFDFADPNAQIGSRSSSTTAPQALLMMNDPFVMEQSKSAATELLAITDLTQAQRIDHAFQQVLGRRPTEHEAKLISQHIGDSNDVARWATAYQTLFQSLDFRYLR